MSSNKKNSTDDTNTDFADLFAFSSEESEFDSEARLISFHFLSEIERVYGAKRGMKTKLAEGTGNSKSFITQLFNGNKFVNFPLLAKFQKLLGIKFKITAYPVNDFPYEQNIATDIPSYNIFIFGNENFASEYVQLEGQTLTVNSAKSIPSEEILN